MNSPYPVVLKPEHQPLLSMIIYELVRPYIHREPLLLEDPRRLHLLADMAALAWNLSRLDGEPEAVGLAQRMRAGLEEDSPLMANIMDDFLRRARTVNLLDAPTSQDVSMVFEGGTLTVTVLPRFPGDARNAEVH